MLLHLHINGMRLWRDVTLSVTPGVPVVIIGPNSSGKSTLLEALDFLGTAAREGLEHAIFAARGGPADVFRADSNTLTITTRFSADPGGPFAADNGPVEYTLALRRVGAHVVVQREEVAVYKRGLLATPLVVVDRTDQRCRLANIVSKAWDDVTPASSELLLHAVRQREHYPTLSHLAEALTSLRVHMGFATLPRWARDPRERDLSPRQSVTVRPRVHLDRHGSDLINALHTLQQHDERRWRYLVAQFQQEFPYVKRLFFPADPGGSKIGLGWRDRRFPDVDLAAEQMSEGMWSYLSLLGAVVPPSPPHVVAFDEPDVHLHTSALAQIVSLLEQLASNTTVIFTSHGSRVLDHLADPAASLRIARPTDDGAALDTLDPSKLNAWLADEPRVSRLRERGMLDPTNDTSEDT